MRHPQGAEHAVGEVMTCRSWITVGAAEKYGGSKQAQAQKAAAAKQPHMAWVGAYSKLLGEQKVESSPLISRFCDRLPLNMCRHCSSMHTLLST